jgi:hypothetical protein
MIEDTSISIEWLSNEICKSVSKPPTKFTNVTKSNSIGGVGYLSNIIALDLTWENNYEHYILPTSIILKVRKI